VCIVLFSVKKILAKRVFLFEQVTLPLVSFRIQLKLLNFRRPHKAKVLLQRSCLFLSLLPRLARASSQTSLSTVHTQEPARPQSVDRGEGIVWRAHIATLNHSPSAVGQFNRNFNAGNVQTSVQQRSSLNFYKRV
jgi:hypothetical protein